MWLKPVYQFMQQRILPNAASWGSVPTVMQNKQMSRTNFTRNEGGKNNGAQGGGPTRTSQNPSQTRWGGSSIAPSQQDRPSNFGNSRNGGGYGGGGGNGSSSGSIY